MTDIANTRDNPQNHEFLRQPLEGTEFILLPGGTGTLGRKYDGSNPEHNASLDSYWIAKTEVTNAQIDAYTAAMGESTHALIGIDNHGRHHVLARGTEAEVAQMTAISVEKIVRGLDLAIVSYERVRVVPEKTRLDGLEEFAGKDQPAVQVTFYQAIGYLAYMSGKTGQDWRLPTNDEWEFAAQALPIPQNIVSPPPPVFPPDELWGAQATMRVGMFAPNAFGIYDMLGNASEWVGEHFAPGESDVMTIRGGSYANDVPTNPEQILSFRNYSEKEEAFPDVTFRAAITYVTP